MSSVSVTAKTHLVGILGWPLSHSVSPQMHNAAFAHLQIPYAYVPLAVDPSSLAAGIHGFKALNFIGANVTIPHKEMVMDHLDELSPLSIATNSVNTLFMRQGRLCGTTTDGLGAVAHLLSQGIDFTNKKIAILGYGGSAKSIAHALGTSQKPREIILCGRSEDKAKGLLDSLQAAQIPCQFVHLAQWDRIRNDIELIINTTPLGMSPHIDASPLQIQQLDSHHIIYDIVYNPRQTLLLQYANHVGAKAISGLGMLVHQGALSQEYWTQVKAPIEIMFEAAERALQ